MRWRLAAAMLGAWPLVAASARGACGPERASFPYPIVMKAPVAARHLPVGSFVAWTRQGHAWRSVPIQVEEVNAAGDYVLAGGLPYTRGTGTGLTDARSELVIDGADLGEEFTPDDLTPAVQAGVRAQWRVESCRGGRRLGQILIQSLRWARVWSGRPEVAFDPRSGAVRTPLYTYRFAAGNPALLGEVKVVRPDGSAAPAIRDAQFRIPLRTPFWLPNVTFTDRDFTSTIESWQSGPLRTIVAVGVKYTSFLSLYNLHLFSELVFYRNRFVIPTQVEFVFDPATYLAAGSGFVYALRFPEGRPWDVTSDLAALPHLAPERAIDAARKATDMDVFKAEAHGPGGSLLVQVRVDPKARQGVPAPFLLRPADFASPAAIRAWPWLRPMAGSDLGVFLDISRIHQGTYDFGLDLLLSSKADDNFTDYGTVDTEWQTLPTPR